MRTIMNLTGKRYGKLLVTRHSHRSKRDQVWECLCDCGKLHFCTAGNLKNGSTKSCGCLRYQILQDMNTTHGEADKYSKTKEYATWIDMKTRCYNEKSQSYQRYGGRGIKVCDRWIDSYENFLTDMGRAPSEDHTIERIHVDNNYEPQNCKWATRTEQMNNTSRTVRFKFRGEIKSMSDWCRDLGLSYHKTRQRIMILKWTTKKAFLTP